MCFVCLDSMCAQLRTFCTHSPMYTKDEEEHGDGDDTEQHKHHNEEVWNAADRLETAVLGGCKTMYAKHE